MKNSHKIDVNSLTIWITEETDGEEHVIGRINEYSMSVRGERFSGVEPNWVLFVEAMKKHHNIDVPEKYRPLWSWEPDRWARYMIKNHGRKALRSELGKMVDYYLHPWGDGIDLAYKVLNNES